MKLYRKSSHSKHDLKVHLVCIPKYRKNVLHGEVTTRARDLLRQIAMENELTIVSGKIAKDHVHMFISYRPQQDISSIVQWLKGPVHEYSFRSLRICEGSFGAGIFGEEGILP